ncbi:MAG: hypothetical protein RLZZ374_1204 [Cyanobacteriota bacterium]
MTETSPNTSPDVSAAAPAGTAEPLTAAPLTAEPLTAARSPEPPPSFVKLAMRNMVRKGRQSLLHFGLTAVGFIGFILLVAWFGRPTLPQ